MKKLLAVLPVVVFLFGVGIAVCLLSYESLQGRWGRYAGGGCFIGCDPEVSSLNTIVFSSPRSGCGDIYVCKSDGSNVRRLTNDVNYEGDPTWSPDGRRIAFVRERNGIAKIWLMNADGTGQTQVTHNSGYDSGPSFSPDGARLVFTRYINRPMYSTDTSVGAEIFVVNIDGTDETRLTTNEEADWEARFSPDGKEIVYSVWSKTLWLMNSDGRNPQRLVQGSSPCFSPDGKTIVFINDPNSDYQYDIFLFDRETKNIQRLTGTGGYKSSPNFSADGKTVLFLVEPKASGTGEMHVLDLSSMSTKTIGTTD